MKKIEITIEKASVMEDVALNTEYTGCKNPEGEGFYDRVATVEADNAILSKFWTETAGELAEKFRYFICDLNITLNSISLILEVSGAYDDSLTPSVITDIFSAIASGVSGRWFRFISPEKGTEWLDRSKLLMDRVYNKLCKRTKPKRHKEEI